MQVAARLLIAPMARTQEPGVFEQELRRQDAFAHEPLWTVEIGEHAFQHGGPLRESSLDTAPLGLGQQQRDRVELPGPLGALTVVVNVVSNAVFPKLPLRAIPPPQQLIALQASDRRAEASHVGPRRSVRVEQLVEHPRDGGIAIPK